MQCKGFLFDLDGTLVDSLPVVERSWCKWADRFSIPHDEVLNFIHGKQAITSLRHFLPGRSEEEIQAEFTLLEMGRSNGYGWRNGAAGRGGVAQDARSRGDSVGDRDVGFDTRRPRSSSCRGAA
ncbi:phosphatase YfbT [Klebsiella michiganensis]|uniref:Phosphatase YfbT n=1 Tax=Klebsiella michiganensis TaxID=1134687 RepID=A0A7H4PP63_9ENTR|nr:phosphatase YfbT [Klebsiella michiganensis]